ncbi:VOC family protein [Cellulomonas aerilata]|uniref:Glyoxalase n=1 Tax=Cellulomonas aerilata TaxID=515326 RepID=A0A512D865_9CELL|nr:VOC family protein [Cellulomonas aerilata]GEO32692.1 glyoxalase [Cellulomonas aerilata]
MTLRGFATLNIWADDVAAAADWYAQVTGVEAYFHRSGPDGRLAYAEFRLGDLQAELGIIDRRFGPPGGASGPGGAIMHWHVDDLEGTLTRLLELGATPYAPVTPRGEGFVTASVVDPFGNVLGIMTNPHYLEMVGGRSGG